MKRIVVDSGQPTIDIGAVTTDNVYAYITGDGRLYVLSRLGSKHFPNKHGEYHYGFVPLSKTNDNPVFLGDDAKAAIQRALNSGNSVMEFDNLTALMKWKLKID